MAGVRGRSGGANKKRPEQRLGNAHEAKAVNDGKATRIKADPDDLPTIPAGNPEWGLVATLMWNAILDAPYKQLMESTDYATAYMTCEAIDKMANSGYRAGQLQAVHSLLRDLGVTEAHRRQIDVFIDRDPVAEAPAPVTQLDKARELFGG